VNEFLASSAFLARPKFHSISAGSAFWLLYLLSLLGKFNIKILR